MKHLNKAWEDRTDNQCQGGLRLPVDIMNILENAVDPIRIPNYPPNYAPIATNYYTKLIRDTRFTSKQTVREDYENRT